MRNKTKDANEGKEITILLNKDFPFYPLLKKPKNVRQHTKSHILQ